MLLTLSQLCQLQLYVRQNAGQLEHFGDQERQIRHDNDDHWFHDVQVMCESCREAASDTHQSSDHHRSDDDHEERHDAKQNVGGDDVLGSDVTEFVEHMIEHLQQVRQRCNRCVSRAS